MDEKIKSQAVSYEGKIPEEWYLEGICECKLSYVYYYRTPEGRFYFTTRKKPKGKRKPKYDLRQEDGREYARPRWTRRLYEVW